MRIILVNKFLYPKGGAETYFLELGKALEDLGHEVEYFGMYDEHNTVTNHSGLYTSPVDFHKLSTDIITYPTRLIWSKEAYEKMKQLIDDFKPDIVHLNNFNYQLTPSVIDAAYEKGIPIIVTAHDSQFVCPNHLMYDYKQNTICQDCIKTGDPMHCVRRACIHGSKAKSLLGSLEGAYYRKTDTYKKIDKIIAPSKFIYDLLKKDERVSNSLIYIQNYVKEPILPKELPDEENFVFYFGRLSKEKGCANIVDAAKALPEIKFVCAGSGPYESEMQGIPNLKLVGFKNKTQLTDYMLRARMTILPSTCYENCPFSVIEAQQCGSAVLAPSYGGAKELTSEKYQIKDTSPEALICAIRKCYFDDNILFEMRQDSKERCKYYTRLPEYTKEIENLYKNII